MQAGLWVLPHFVARSDTAKSTKPQISLQAPAFAVSQSAHLQIFGAHAGWSASQTSLPTVTNRHRAAAKVAGIWPNTGKMEYNPAGDWGWAAPASWAGAGRWSHGRSRPHTAGVGHPRRAHMAGVGRSWPPTAGAGRGWSRLGVGRRPEAGGAAGEAGGGAQGRRSSHGER